MRTQRKTPAPPIRQSSAIGVDPYLHPSSGIPLYKYRYSKYYGNLGCRVFKGKIQNLKDFWLKINIPIYREDSTFMGLLM